MKDKTMLWPALLCGLVVFAVTTEARIKLVALPARESTTIRLDNPFATLIEEERTLTLQKGVNKVDFSWKGVDIDVDSIRLAVSSTPDSVRLLNVSYPPNEAALVWEISSDAPREETVRISYLLRNIDRLITYKAVADKAETNIGLNSYVVLRNFSGEDFSVADVLLDYGKSFEQGIQNEETKQLLFLSKSQIPITKMWRFDAARLPWDPEKVTSNVGIPVFYELKNSEANGLGSTAMWGGRIRVYQDDGHGSTIFLGEDDLPLLPVGEEAEIYIGESRDIVVTQHKMQDRRINIRRNNSNRIVLYDTDEEIRAKIENFKDTPAVLTMLQHIPGQWDMKMCSMDYTLKDAGTLEFEIQLPPKGKKELVMHYHRRNVR